MMCYNAPVEKRYNESLETGPSVGELSAYLGPSEVPEGPKKNLIFIV